MADAPHQGSSGLLNCELQYVVAGVTLVIITAFSMLIITNVFYRNELNLNGKTKESSSKGKKSKKKRSPKSVALNFTNAMFGDGNILHSAPISPPLLEGRNKDPTKIMQNTVAMWEKHADDVFVTKGLRSVRDASKKNNMLIITGPQGSGKSTALRFVSLGLKKDGYTVYPCTKPSEIVYYWDDAKWQAFVIDDPIGSECISLTGVEKLEKHEDNIKHCIESRTTKVLLAVRSEIINDRFVSSSKTLTNWRKFGIELTDDEHALSDQEKKDMLSHYLSRSGVRFNSPLQMPTLHCFPLLCHAFCKVGEIRHRNPSEFFSSPFDVIKETFIRMREHNPPHFCALALCAVYRNLLSIRYISPDSPERDRVDRVMELLGIDREKTQKKVMNALDALNGVYLTKNGRTFSFLHSVFEDLVTFILGEESTEFLFQYCSSTFLRSYVRIVDTAAVPNEHAIVLERSDYNRLAQRMCRELKNNNIEDIFYHSALRNRRFLKVFMKKCSEDKTLEYGNENSIPLLAWSCRMEMFRLTRDLLKNGAALNICDKTKKSALMWVCRNNSRPIKEIRKIVRELLEAGASVDLIDIRNHTALKHAIRKGDVDIVNELLEHHASVNQDQSDAASVAPLNMAVKIALKHKRTKYESDQALNQPEQNSTKIVKLLLERGANPNLKCNDDKTLLYLSVSRANIAIFRCLLDNGADVNLSNTSNEDLLCSAISNCPSDVIESLLDRNVDVNRHDASSKSPLHHAVMRNNCDLVAKLIKCGACVNCRDVEGETPLHISVKGQMEAITDVLLRNKADSQAEDKYGRTPIMWFYKLAGIHK